MNTPNLFKVIFAGTGKSREPTPHCILLPDILRSPAIYQGVFNRFIARCFASRFVNYRFSALIHIDNLPSVLIYLQKEQFQAAKRSKNCTVRVFVVRVNTCMSRVNNPTVSKD